ncbi:MAG: DUF192 domain-containing protein [Actinomycetota bacterium]|nr:DUF192 domain-containing protein [Actinomycetota bacterium]
MSRDVGAAGNAGGDARADRRVTWARRGVVVVLLAGVLAFLVEGADQPADPVLVPAGEQAEARANESAAPLESGAGRSPAAGPSTTASTSTTSSSTPAPATLARPDDGRPASTLPAPGPRHIAPPPSTATAPPPPARRPLAGFDEVAFRITGAGGAFDGVALLADDQRSRNQGLMEQRDLRGYDGMVFRFDGPSTGRFYMRNTLIPLSIAFFDAGGRFVSATDMVPCPDEVEECPRYPADRPYVHAIEVPSGGLARLGIGPGAVLSFP